MATSEYYESYKARVSHMGKNPQEKAFKSGILEFRRNLRYNEHTVRGLRKNGYRFDGVILTDKQDENRVSQILLVDLETEIGVGNLIQWNDDYWLIYKKTISSYQPYNKFYMVQCNYLLKWVDLDGMLQQSWCHIVGNKDSKIKDNFRSWNSLITPQPNKFLEIMMPYRDIAKSTDVLVNGEGWTLVEYDKSSVPEIIYMSFTEGKVNDWRDVVKGATELEDNIANYDRQHKWKIEGPAKVEFNNIGDIVQLDYQIYCQDMGMNEQDRQSNTVSLVNIDPKNIQFKLSKGLKFNSEGQIVVTEVTDEPQGFTRNVIISYPKSNIAIIPENSTSMIQEVVQNITKNYAKIVGNDYIRVSTTEEYIIDSNYLTDSNDINIEIYNNNKQGNKVRYIKNITPPKFSTDDYKWHFFVQANDKNWLTNDIDYLKEDQRLAIRIYNGPITSRNLLDDKNIKIVALWQVV